MHTAIFMAKQDSLMRAAILLSIVAATHLGAQVVETPVPFDSAARVRVLTPALAQRFALGPPAWPVTGDFVAARLYAVSGGGTILAVERPNGQVERYALVDEHLVALRTAVQVAQLANAEPVRAERPAEATLSARRAFARNQMILSTVVHGPFIASFADDGKTGTALYLLSVGASFFVVNNIAKNLNVTHTQNALATDGTLRGAVATTGLLFAFGGDNVDRKLYSAVGLAGAIGGAKLGFEYGRRLTDSEGQAARKFSTLGAAMTLGVLGALGTIDDEDRPVIGAAVAGGLAGYVIGPAYPRRASYNVTAGDVRTLPVGAILGAAAGLTPFIRNDSNRVEVLYGAATAGGIAGTLLVDRLLVRKFDYSNADATQLWLGTLAGGLLGGALVVLAEPQSVAVGVGLVTAGAILGTIGGHSLAKPNDAGPRGALRETGLPVRLGSTRLQFAPANLAFAASRVPGNYPVLSLRF
jgi:hypothetical protein